MITRKIEFALISTLLFFPLSGSVQAGAQTSVERMLMEKAAGGLVSWGMGQGMSTLFPEPEASPSLTDIQDDINAGFTKLSDQLNATETRLTQKIDDSWKKTHLNLLENDGKAPLEAKVEAYNPYFVEAGGSEVQTNDLALQDIINAANQYSKMLSTDIRIGEGIKGFNGFWRSFNPYVSNQLLTFSFNMERWSSNQRKPDYPVTGKNPVRYALETLRSLESIYNHLEKDVPTLPVYPSNIPNSKPQQQRVNCAIRTDPDTQLFTSEGEFIRRYRGVHDVANELPDPTRYNMMYEYCRTAMHSNPNVYYGWDNVNRDQWFNAGQLVGPHDLAEACRRTVTFGTCQDHRSAYGCIITPTHTGKYDGNIIDKTKRSRGNTKYTKYLWDIDAPHAMYGVIAQAIRQGELSKPNYGNFATHLFNGYVRKYENSICVSAPNRKNIAAQIKAAPVLPHLTDELFSDTPSKLKGMPKSELYQAYLPLTVSKVPGKMASSNPDSQKVSDVDAYFFIKRNHNKKIPELSKPYASPLSAAYARSLHFFTEYKDQGLDGAYCNIASLVGMGNLLLKGIEKKISNKENYPDWSSGITLQSVASLRSKYIHLSYKLGITQEDARRCDTHTHKISPHIITKHKDAILIHNDMRDHTLKACMKLAAIDAYEKRAASCKKPNGGPIGYGLSVSTTGRDKLTCERGKGEFQRPPLDLQLQRQIRGACKGTKEG